MSAGFQFDNTFAKNLEGFYAPWQATTAPAPKLLCLNRNLARELGLDPDAYSDERWAEIFSGNELPEGASPLAQAYAGHQFGGFVPQLGDGRALLLGELIDASGRRRDLQLKGSGPTPFSRGGDGKAAIGPVLREHLVSEAMHALGIPTTRALASVATGDLVYREAPLPGAVLTRVARSHIRVGTFQFFAARGQVEKVRQLADYCVERHYPALADCDDRYLELLGAVVEAQAHLVARWMLVGFVHGVMNTDNTAISGETIDYGPCAFLEAYDPATVYSSIDHGGRYAYGNQPAIAQWNLARFAETLIPLLEEDEERAIERATEVVDSFAERYRGHWLDGMRKKLGLFEEEPEDLDLAVAFLGALEGQSADFTLAFRRLAEAAAGNEGPLRALFDDATDYEAWAGDWRRRCAREEIDLDERVVAMNRVNPIYLPRNHRVEEALATATSEGDLEPFSILLDVVTTPFVEKAGRERFAEPAPPDFGPYRTFCGT